MFGLTRCGRIPKMSFRGNRRSRARIALLAATVVFVSVACGSDGSSGTSPSAVPTSQSGVPTTTIRPGTSPTTQTPVTSDDAGGAPTSSEAVSTTIAPESDVPKAPTGLFLSSHELSLGSGSGPTKGRSVCRTSANVSCQVRFSKDGRALTLPAQRTDAQGDTSWDWSPATVGLDVGHWSVEVVASAGGAQATSRDAVGLTVVP